MAARYVVLKKTRQQANVKVIGTGTVTIPLSDFALADETPVTPEANITFLYWNVPSLAGNFIEIVRGGVTTQYLTGGDNWNLSQGTGITDTENSTDAIVVNITGGSGTLIFSVNKAGWSVPEFPQGTGR